MFPCRGFTTWKHWCVDLWSGYVSGYWRCSSFVEIPVLSNTHNESHVRVGVLLALGYGRLWRLRKEAWSANCEEDKLIEIGSKWPKEQKRSEVRESKSLDGEIEEDKSARNMDHGKLSKRKNPPMDTLAHLIKKKERRAGKALKTQVRLT